MSWFSDLADKAENLLNKIDQNAAAVLQEKPSINKLHENLIDDKEKTPDVKFDKIKRESNILRNKARSLKGANKKNLNTNVTNRSQSSTYTNDIENNIDKAIVLEVKNEVDQIDWKHNEKAQRDDVIDDVKIGIDDLLKMDSSVAYVDKSIHIDAEKFDVENAMLKNEISVVHNELSILLSKVKNSEKVTEDTQFRLMQMEKSYNQVLKENNGLHGKIASYEKKLNDIEESVTDEKLIKENDSLKEKIGEFEYKIKSIITHNDELKNDLKSSQNMCLELEEKLEKAKLEVNNTLEEWKNYKIRANNTLTMKEKIIETLGGNQEENESDLATSLNVQIEQLKIERNEAVEEHAHLKSEFESKMREYDQLEFNLRSSERQMANLRDNLRQEKSLKDIAEQTVGSLSKELQILQTETAKQISSMRIKLEDNKLKQSESLSNTSFGSSESGEERFRSLTQALVAKQAALESVTGDRNALRLQLEKTENKYRSDLVSMRNNRPRIIDVNYTDDAKERFPSLLQESPWDSSISRRVKKAYSTLDSCGVRIGMFLRRNPIARIFILAYMAILHLWVLVVLCTYTPEIHDK